MNLVASISERAARWLDAGAQRWLARRSSPGVEPPPAGTAHRRTESILKAVPDAVIGIDAEGWVVLISPAAANVFGHDPQSTERVRLSDWLPELDSANMARRTAEGLHMRASGMHVARFEMTARRRDGTGFPADVSLSMSDHDDEVGYTCVVRDITEQRMALSMLNLYNRALECTSNGVVISDMTLPGSPVFYANPAFHRITGYDVGDAIGRNCKFLQRDDTEQPELQQLRAAIGRGESCTVVIRNYRKDGSMFFNELAVAPVTTVDGRVQHYVGILNDVTERERTRMAIAERSARLNAVFELSPDGFVVFSEAGELVYGNRAFMTMTGWQASDLSGPMALEEFDRRLTKLMDPEQPVRSLAEVLTTSGGTADVVNLMRPERRVLARDVRRQIGGRGETILFLRDVTRETEVNRMKSEFLTTAAHELRTPMVSVFGFTELLLNRPVTEPRRRDMLETIHRQSQLLINMVNELLDLARIEARQGKDLKRAVCRLQDTVTQAVATFAEIDGDRLRVSLTEADPWVLVNSEKIQRALTNVLSNAFKYADDDSEVELEVVHACPEGVPMVGVRVTDHGIGMRPEQLARVFERFYRADPSGNVPGTGLGMSLVKEIIELHGGHVNISSTPGLGTVVTLWLPLALEPVTA